MKRTLLSALVIGALLMMGSPAGAKWRLITKSRSGSWFVSDRVVTVQGDCKTVLVGVIHKKPMMSRTHNKLIGARKFTTRICCRAKTYQFLGYTLVDVKKKNFYHRRLKVPLKPIKPGSVMATIARHVCAPGFGATSGVKAPAPAVKAPAAPGVKKPAAADSYKKTCRFCSNSGGVWLCCTCKTNTGANKRSCLDPRKCAGRGISNCNGVLTCGPCK